MFGFSVIVWVFYVAELFGGCFARWFRITLVSLSFALFMSFVGLVRYWFDAAGVCALLFVCDG